MHLNSEPSVHGLTAVCGKITTSFSGNPTLSPGTAWSTRNLACAREHPRRLKTTLHNFSSTSHNVSTWNSIKSTKTLQSSQAQEYGLLQHKEIFQRTNYDEQALEPHLLVASSVAVHLVPSSRPQRHPSGQEPTSGAPGRHLRRRNCSSQYLVQGSGPGTYDWSSWAPGLSGGKPLWPSESLDCEDAVQPGPACGGL